VREDLWCFLKIAFFFLGAAGGTKGGVLVTEGGPEEACVCAIKIIKFVLIIIDSKRQLHPNANTVKE